MKNRILNKIGRDRQLLLTIGLTFGVRVITALGALALNLLLARKLGAVGVGLFTLAFSMIVALGVLARFGMDAAIQRHGSVVISRRNHRHFLDIRRQALTIALPMGIGLGVCLFLLRHPLANVYNKPELAELMTPMALLLPIMTLVAIQGSWLRALQKPVFAPFFEATGLSLMVGLMIITLILTRQPITLDILGWTLPAASFALLIIGIFYLRVLTRRAFEAAPAPEPAASVYSGFYKTLPDFLIINIAMFLLQWSTPIVLGLFADNAEVGIFATAYRLASALSIIMLVFNGVTTARFAELYHNHDLQGLRQLVQSSSLYMMLLALPPAALLVVFPEFVLSFFGKSFQAAAPLLVIMAAAYFVNTVFGSAVQLLTMSGHQREIRNIVIGTGFFSLTATMLFSYYWGSTGAASAFTISLMLQNFLAVRKVRQLLGINVMPLLKLKS
jgi:O-antigen/teichoic acid export membrane protein